MLAGCQDAERILIGAQAQADRTAATAALAPLRIAAGPFDLQAYRRAPAAPTARLVVYLESDGHAWDSNGRMTADPTPLRPLMLEMAAADPAVAVAYIARPCQYQHGPMPAACHPAFWTNGRFAPAVVDATNAAVDSLIGTTRAREIVLVGYSGGGVLAALVAARRSDVVGLVTVASPLDHARWTSLHSISQLRGSLNPVDFAARLSTIPQIHLVGARDDIVPRAPVDSYVARLPDGRRTRVVVVPGQTHDCCWAGSWRDLLAREVEPWFAQAAR
jgi:dienelactone hydrolase